MSNYRNDEHDILVISDSTKSGFSTRIDDVLRLGTAIAVGVMTTVTVHAQISDSVVDSSLVAATSSATISDSVYHTKQSKILATDNAKIKDHIKSIISAQVTDTASIIDDYAIANVASRTTDRLTVSDQITGSRTALVRITDKAKISDTPARHIQDNGVEILTIGDSIRGKLRARSFITDIAIMTDELPNRQGSLTTDTLNISDSVLARRFAAIQATDTLRVSDRISHQAIERLSDSVQINDSAQGKLHASARLADSLTIADSLPIAANQSGNITERLSISDSVFVSLHSSIQVTDIAVITDQSLQVGGLYAQAWTAGTDNWAMSRYEPYNYSRLAVIDGVLYGEGDKGVYRLDDHTGVVAASIKTGKIDLGQGALTHPTYAYLEYELQGSAAMNVYTTQGGSTQMYNYVLPSKPASSMTSNRFVFGRGLIGRHFAFELSLLGSSAYINDLTIDHAPTRRRV